MPPRDVSRGTLVRSDELSTLIAKTKRAEGATLIELCVDAIMGGRFSPKEVHHSVSRILPDITPEAVKACLDSQAYWEKRFEAEENPRAWELSRLRRVRIVHAALEEVEELMSSRNKDKRTQTANLHFRLGLAGHTPQTKVEHGADEDFLGFLTRMMTPKEVGVPERVAIPERMEGTE